MMFKQLREMSVTFKVSLVALSYPDINAFQKRPPKAGIDKRKESAEEITKSLLLVSTDRPVQ